jgi:glutamine synthetase type III
MSVFLGSYLTKMLDEIEERVTDKKMTRTKKPKSNWILPHSRNFYSITPTGNELTLCLYSNRFEFRAVGSNAIVQPR